MASIEASKPELLGVLPQQEYDRFSRNPQNRSLPKALLKLFSDIPLDASGDVFGQIYEYFLGNFAMSEGQGASAPLRGRASLSRPLLARTGHALVCTLLQTTSGFSGVNCGRGNLGRKDGRGRVPRVERKERLKDLREKIDVIRSDGDVLGDELDRGQVAGDDLAHQVCQLLRPITESAYRRRSHTVASSKP